MSGFVTVRIPDELKDRIDAARPATTSREAWVRAACVSALEAGQTAAASVGQQVEPEDFPSPPEPSAPVVPSALPRTHERETT